MENEKQPSTKLILAGLLLGLLVSSLNQAITVTAMTTTVQELGGISLFGWTLSIYMLMATASIPIYGKLAALYGRKRTYMLGMVLFLLGSSLCGLTGNMTHLIVFRGIQGLGAGSMLPITFAIVRDLFPPERRNKLQSIFASVFSLASILGPALGGFLTELLSWYWVCFFNLFFGVAAICLLAIGYRENRNKHKLIIDWPGAITLGGSVIAIFLALVLGDAGMQTEGMLAGFYGLGGILLGLFLWMESQVKAPILPLALFRHRLVSSASVVSFFVSAGMFGAITFVPFFLHEVRGVGPALAGAMVIPYMLAYFVGNVVSMRLMSRFTYRQIVLTSLLIIGVGFGLLSMIDTQTTLQTVATYMIVAGLGTGQLMPVLKTAMQSAVSKQHSGSFPSLLGFVRSMGSTIGVCLMGILIYVQPDHSLGIEIEEVFTLGFFFVIMALLAALFLGKAQLNRGDSSELQSLQARRSLQ
ncbi:MFS transporter [Brevibacillus nitrificans]|uniref:MFS transporter n=1 Tax=Brevibacillus nitrificans TaxID=651560 RepID=UPI002601675C|nr:MFS transporter [Brevibacillus nitrificans]